MVGDMSFRGDAPFLRGMTSLSCDKQLLPDYGCVITWKAGYDESIFAGEELVCIIPEGAVEDYDNGNGEITLSFTYRVMGTSSDGSRQEVVNNEYQCTLKIVGTYTAGDEKSIYCCAGMRISAIDENSVVIRHPHGDLEYIEDIETEFCIKEEK